jgi:signal transduction histidine kinase
LKEADLFVFSKRRNTNLPVNSRVILTAGFGGLLLLMAFSAVDNLRSLEQIQSSNDTIREEFLRRTRVLERIRSDLYVSGTYVRDYLLEPESGKAEGHRYSLLETRQDMQAALDRYGTLIDAQETVPFQGLTRALVAYWSVLEPVFRWTSEQRKTAGDAFLRDQVFPRRQSMLAIADRIGDLNEAQLNVGKAKVEQTFRDSRQRQGLTIVLTIGFGLVLATFSMRKILGLGAETAQHYKEIVSARAELQQLSARLVEAQEDERRSISRELHDEVGQALTGVLVEMANLSTLIRARDLDGAAAKAAEVKTLIEDSIRVVRNLALLLRPSMLDDLGLVPALEWQAREVSKRGGVWVEVAAEQVSEELPEEHKTCVYRLMQEALHNIVQHAGARRVKVAVCQKEGRLRLSIEDDGHGFDAKRQKGLGLLGMEERVKHLGGSFEVESRPGAGTVLSVSLPLPAAEAAS